MTHTPLGPGAEFDRIRNILRRLGEAAGSTGDDCAIVTIGGVQLAISTDIALEGTHFKLGWMSPVEVGWRAAAAALSDLAAVAATPNGVLVSLAVPDDWPEEFVTELMEGFGEAARSVDAKVWGGDLVRSDRVAIDAVVVGAVERPVFRKGAGVRDGLWVTGALGGPAVALKAWNDGTEPEGSARGRFVHPEPRVAEAMWLRERGAKAMIDISDGLVGDAAHLAAASGVAFAIESDRVPIHPAVPTPETALVSGEEYELLLALPRDVDPELSQSFEETFHLPLTRVGRAELGAGVRVLKGGSPIGLPVGFRHF